MKKFGFTMAELLVTLTIIGVVAAITAPIIDNITPDKNKSKVLKAYRVISEINEDLLNDPSLYMYNGTCEGFGCTAAPSDPKYSVAPYAANNSGLSKYGMLFFDKMDLTPTWNNMIGRAASKDGIDWLVAPKLDGSNLESMTIQIFVGKAGERFCVYGSNGCSKPNVHQFKVNLDGRVEGIDKLTRAYLLNPTKLNDKKNDYAKAASLQ